MKAYGFEAKTMTGTNCVAELMKRYQQYIARLNLMADGHKLVQLLFFENTIFIEKKS